jgi:hypothetical protein
MIAQRRMFTGETSQLAAPGVQGRSHGLDECSREQWRFRAVPAVLMLNEGWQQLLSTQPHTEI